MRLPELPEGVSEHLTAANAWKAVGALVVAYEIVCPKGELMSEGVDRGLEKHPMLTRAAIGVTALHLLNVIPEKYDPFTNLSKLIGK